MGGGFPRRRHVHDYIRPPVFTRHPHSLRDAAQKMETMVAKEGVHTQCSRSSAVQHSANNGKFSIVRAVLHCYALCVDEGLPRGLKTGSAQRFFVCSIPPKALPWGCCAPKPPAPPAAAPKPPPVPAPKLGAAGEPKPGAPNPPAPPAPGPACCCGGCPPCPARSPNVGESAAWASAPNEGVAALLKLQYKTAMVIYAQRKCVTMLNSSADLYVSTNLRIGITLVTSTLRLPNNFTIFFSTGNFLMGMREVPQERSDSF